MSVLFTVILISQLILCFVLQTDIVQLLTTEKYCEGLLSASVIYQDSSMWRVPLTGFHKHKNKRNLYRLLTFGRHTIHLINILAVLIICLSNHGHK